jgi:hypothetical protein
MHTYAHTASSTWLKDIVRSKQLGATLYLHGSGPVRLDHGLHCKGYL